MGQKVNPYGFRLGFNKNWKSRWFASSRDYAKTLHEDLAIREALLKSPEAKGADIGDIEIIRQPNQVNVVISTARPGVLIGAKGANITRTTAELQKLTQKKLQVKIKEIKKPDTDAQVVALNIARQLSGRVAFRRVLKKSIENARKGGVKGIKVRISGRLGGADMARALVMKEGRIPLHTLRADIDYGFAEAETTYGIIGVKVWIFNGEILNSSNKEDAGLLVKSKGNTKGGAQNA